MPEQSTRIQERILFSNPWTYRLKCFLIQTVIWKCILSGIFRLKPRPLTDADPYYAGKKLLLAACGPGDVSTGPPVDSAADITAFDISEEFVESCKKNRPTWHVQVADVQKLPYANGEFDVCVIYSSLHHIPINARDVMAELGRVTRGRIVFFEGVVPERGFLRWMLLLWYKIMDGGCHYYTEEELRAIFEKLPLRVERLTRHGPIAHMLFGVLDVSDAARA